MLSVLLSTNLVRELVLYGRIGTNYQLQYNTHLGSLDWQPWVNFTQTNAAVTVGVNSTNSLIFYRLLQR